MKNIAVKSLNHQVFWEVIGKTCRFLTFIAIARHLDIADFGIFIFVITFLEILNVIMDFKVDIGIVRQINRGQIPVNRAMGDALVLKLISGGATLLLSFPIFFLFTHSIEKLAYLACASIALLMSQLTNVFKIILQIKLKLELLTLCRGISGFFLLIVSLLILHYGFTSIMLLLIIYSISFIIEPITIFFFSRHLFNFDFNINYAEIKQIFGEGLFFSITNIVVIFYYKIDTLLMQIINGPTQLGLYNAAYRLLDASMFVPMAVAAIFYPIMLKRNIFEPGGWLAGQKAIDFLICSAIILSVFIFLNRDIIISVTYGDKFKESALVLGILFLAVIFLYPSAITCQTMIVLGMEKLLLYIHISAAIIAVPAYWFAINTYGIIGAAAVTVFLQAWIFISTVWCISLGGVHVSLNHIIKIAFLFSLPMYGASLLPLEAAIRSVTILLAGSPAVFWMAKTVKKNWNDLV